MGYEYTVKFLVDGKMIAVEVVASCHGNAKAVARGRLPETLYGKAVCVACHARSW